MSIDRYRRVELVNYMRRKSQRIASSLLEITRQDKRVYSPKRLALLEPVGLLNGLNEAKRLNGLNGAQRLNVLNGLNTLN